MSTEGTCRAKFIFSDRNVCVCVCVCVMEYYSTIKKKEILPSVTMSTDLEGTMLSEVSQAEKDKYQMISLICGI